ncbi:ABC transporter substrate-binding protein [Ostreibacterium oceani]|uniref:ABC transporter substrate-binding protein n=1 Tax=Ostreibacterium oceani TaxID=2654998 RepID=A0A6N7EWX4_9GAMM|nr:ABC transporter substrate-binding protein [Ostreibacterium oceani]MPV85627.1 ABC transporter substrate-binding protein [Ostreibacterium oceani]
MKLTTKMKTLTLAIAMSFSLQAADLTIAYDSDPVSMDPMEQLSGATLQMSHLLFDPLVRTNSQLEYVPRLAERWEKVSPTVTRFYLRQGVKFHSGNDMTADDVIWSFNRYRESGDFKAVFEPYAEMVKVDDHTVELIAKAPYPLVLANATYLFVMDSKFYTGQSEDGKAKDAIEKNTGSFASTNVSGTGVFKLKSRQQGVELVLEKNPDYWGESGNVENVKWVPIKENATRLAALLSGGVDLISPVAPTDLDRVEQSDNHHLLTLPSDRIITVQLNQKVVPEFKDVRVRQAVIHAINNEGIVDKIMRGFATPAGQNSPVGYAGHDPSLTPRFDLDKAKALMKEAGYEDGFTVTMISPNDRYVNDEKIAQAIAAMLARINIKVELTTMPKAQYWPEFDKCENGIQLIGWSSDTGDSANYSEYLTMTRDAETGRGQYNCGHYSNPEMDALVNAANQETDAEKRAALLKQVSKIEYDDAAFVPLHWQNLSWGLANKVTNLKDYVNLKEFPLLGDLIIEE